MGFDGSAIERLLDAAVDDGHFHGVAALVTGRDGVLHQSAHGAAAADTMFRNASLTKAVATTAALQLVEQGRLELDAPVASVLPEFGELQVLDGFDGDTPVLRAPKSPPTIRQLMTHTSGCGYFFSSEELLRYAALVPEWPSNPLAGRKDALRGPLLHDPGEIWEYGVSVDWLGLVVEELTGQTLGEYLAEHVYGPLGMGDSTFHPTEAQRARLLTLCQRQGDGSLTESPIDLAPESEWDAAGHGSFGTIADYGRFVRAWLRGGELDGTRILAEETVAMALQDHSAGAPIPDIHSAIPELSHDVPALPVPQGWGLGFHLVGVDLPGMRSAGTGDWAGIFNCYYWIDRTAGIGGVLMTQILPFFDPKVVETLIGFETAVYAEVGGALPVG